MKTLAESFAGMPKWNDSESERHRSPKRSKFVHDKNGRTVEVRLVGWVGVWGGRGKGRGTEGAQNVFGRNIAL